MNKKLYVLMSVFLVLVFSFNSISGQGNNSSKNAEFLNTKKVENLNTVSTVVNEQSVKDNGAFYLGMSRKDVSLKIKEMKMEVINEVEITSNSKTWDFGNKVIWTDELSFSFDKADKLYEIIVLDKIATTKGLKIGDTREVLIKKYGAKNASYRNGNAIICEYIVGGQYFRAFIEDGKVSKWGISKFRFDKV